MAAAGTIFGTTKGFVWEIVDGVTYYVPLEGLTDTEVTFLESKYAGADNLKGDLDGVTYTPTGQDAVYRFGQYTLSYDPTNARWLLANPVSEVGETYEQAEVNSIVSATNAIRSLVR